MLYRIGDTRVFRYEARRRVTGMANDVMVAALRPDGTWFLISANEIDNGSNPIFRGIYECSVTFDQDGEWLITFDIPFAQHTRPSSVQVTVNTSLVDQIFAVASALEIDQQLSDTHGDGSWEAPASLPAATRFSQHPPSD